MKRSQLTALLAIAMAAPTMAAVIGAGDVPDQPPQRPKAEVFSGTIRAVNTDRRVITLEATPLTKTFGVSPDCEVMTQTKPKASLSDLMVGSAATVTYEDAGGELLAHRIEQKGPPAEAARQEGRFTLTSMWLPGKSG